MAREVEGGFRNEELRSALHQALSGDTTRLERLLARHGPTPSGKPNLKLAAALGIELGGLPGPFARLLTRLGAEDAAPDTAQVFLPIAAAHGWTACVRMGREVEPAWAALAELAADERTPVRIGTLDALLAIALRPGGADELVERATEWLDHDNADIGFGAAALAVEALADPRLLAALSSPESAARLSVALHRPRGRRPALGGALRQPPTPHHFACARALPRW